MGTDTQVIRRIRSIEQSYYLYHMVSHCKTNRLLVKQFFPVFTCFPVGPLFHQQTFPVIPTVIPCTIKQKTVMSLFTEQVFHVGETVFHCVHLFPCRFPVNGCSACKAHFTEAHQIRHEYQTIFLTPLLINNTHYKTVVFYGSTVMDLMPSYYIVKPRV